MTDPVFLVAVQNSKRKCLPLEFNLSRYEGYQLQKDHKRPHISFRKTIIFLKHTQDYAILLI